MVDATVCWMIHCLLVHKWVESNADDALQGHSLKRVGVVKVMEGMEGGGKSKSCVKRRVSSYSRCTGTGPVCGEGSGGNGGWRKVGVVCEEEGE